MSIIEREQVDETLEEIRALPETHERKTREQIYREAADLIDEKGWVAVRTGDPTIGFCLVGAIGYVAVPAEPYQSPYDVAEILAGVDHTVLTGWNDGLRYKPRRTRRFFGDVIPPKQRVTNCLRLMADGSTFHEASAVS